MRPNHLLDIQFDGPFFIGKVLWTSTDEARSLVDLRNGLDALGVIAVGPGRFVYHGPYAAALSRVKTMARDIGRKLGHDEWYLPKLVPGSTLDNFGCTSVWPAYLMKVGQYEKGNMENTIHADSGEYFLDPVQCAAFYEALSFLDLNKVCPLKIMDISGYTYRNEYSHKLNSTMKTIEFLRAEYVFVGRDLVKQARSALFGEYMALLDACRMQWRLVVGQGCYDNPSEDDKEEYAKAQDIESVPILDLEIYSKSLGEWVETIGGSYFHDHKLRRFGHPDKGLESGCMGVGLTRLAGLMLEYMGTEVESW